MKVSSIKHSPHDIDFERRRGSKSKPKFANSQLTRNKVISDTRLAKLASKVSLKDEKSGTPVFGTDLCRLCDG